MKPQSPSSRAGAILVTDGAGFIGCNLADRLASDGGRVIVLDSLARPGVEANMDWLRARHRGAVEFIRADVRDAAAVEAAVRDCAAVYHLAAQVAVTTSIESPRHDLETNLIGTFNVLEASRRSPHRPPVIMASTNKVYGSMPDLPVALTGRRWMPADAALARRGIGENTALSLHTPYGCSKGAADQYVLDHAATFGLRTVALRMSCIYGPRQCGTEDQGWVAHFAAAILSGRPISIFGDGRQVRDVMHVDDAVEAYVRALASIDQISGRAFNLGGGPSNAVSLAQVLELIAELTGMEPDLSYHGWRPGDQRWYVSDTAPITAALGLPRPMSWRQGIAHLVGHMQSGNATVRAVGGRVPQTAAEVS
jgi:CDP-paratose 2-epimerase